MYLYKDKQEKMIVKGIILYSISVAIRLCTKKNLLNRHKTYYII